MRNAALVLGLIGGIWAMLVGFFVYGYVEFVDWFGEVPDLARQVEDPALFRTVSILSPLLAIAGAAMARARALWGGILMLLAAGASTTPSASASSPCSRSPFAAWPVCWRWQPETRRGKGAFLGARFRAMKKLSPDIG
jgi:hypothetical protein